MPIDDHLRRYVALGDSYTIGTSVQEAERWPNQLVAALAGGTLRGQPAPLALVANLGVNGFTSREVIAVQLPRLDGLEPSFVSILVGVNDVVQNVPPETYRANLELILDDLVARVGARRVVLVTIPDYTVTPAGAAYGDPARRSAEIRARNATAIELAGAREIEVVDVYDLSLGAAVDPALVAADGLHPSGAQYALWVGRIAPAVRGLLAG